MSIEMVGVRDYGEGYPVKLVFDNGRLCVVATTQGGNDSTTVDLLDIVSWYKANEHFLKNIVLEIERDSNSGRYEPA